MPKLPPTGSTLYEENAHRPHIKTVKSHPANGQRVPSMRVQGFRRLHKLGAERHYEDSNDCDENICASLWAHFNCNLKEIEKKTRLWDADNELIEKLCERFKRCRRTSGAYNVEPKKSVVWILRPRHNLRYSKTNIFSRYDAKPFNPLRSQHKLATAAKKSQPVSKAVLKSAKDYYNECKRLINANEPHSPHTKLTAPMRVSNKPSPRAKLNDTIASTTKLSKSNAATAIHACAINKSSASSHVSDSADEVFFSVEKTRGALPSKRLHRNTHVLHIDKRYDFAAKEQEAERKTSRNVRTSNSSMLVQCSESAKRMKDFDNLKENCKLEVSKRIVSKDMHKQAEKAIIPRRRGSSSAGSGSESSGKRVSKGSKALRKARKSTGSHSSVEASAKRERTASRRRLKRKLKACRSKGSMEREESFEDMSTAFRLLFHEREAVVGAKRGSRSPNQKSLMTLSNGAYTISFHRPMPPHKYTPSPTRTLDFLVDD